MIREKPKKSFASGEICKPLEPKYIQKKKQVGQSTEFLDGIRLRRKAQEEA